MALGPDFCQLLLFSASPHSTDPPYSYINAPMVWRPQLELHLSLSTWLNSKS